MSGGGGAQEGRPSASTPGSTQNLSETQPVIRAVTAGDQPDLSTIPVQDVGPQLTSWLPGLLEDLLPTVTRTVRSLAVDAGLEPADGDWASTRQGRVAWRLTEQLAPEVLEGVEQADVAVEKQEWILAAVRWALPHECAGEGYEEDLRETLTKIGTGRGAWNAGLPALRVVASLLAHAPEQPTLRVHFDAQAWADLDDRATGQRALAAVTILATAVDVELVFASPRMRRTFTTRYGRWLEAHLDLTDCRDWARALEAPGGSSDEEAKAIAFEALTLLCALLARAGARLGEHRAVVRVAGHERGRGAT